MNNRELSKVLKRLKKAAGQWKTPVVTEISRGRDPFRVLIGCVLSLRTRDAVTDAASRRLFALADRPEAVRSLSPETIEKAIYPVAFYRRKAESILKLCGQLIDRYESRVPDSIEELLTLPGVGRKTANLTVILGHGGMGICVDIHVHRISNRWAYVDTRSPDATEFALRQKLPKKYWQEYNGLLVTFGQNVCKPVSPLCGSCGVGELCPRVGVARHR